MRPKPESRRKRTQHNIWRSPRHPASTENERPQARNQTYLRWQVSARLEPNAQCDHLGPKGVAASELVFRFPRRHSQVRHPKPILSAPSGYLSDYATPSKASRKGSTRTIGG